MNVSHDPVPVTPADIQLAKASGYGQVTPGKQTKLSHREAMGVNLCARHTSDEQKKQRRNQSETGTRVPWPCECEGAQVA